MRQTDRHFKFDWITILLFFILAGFGWLNILSASHTGEIIDYFSFTEFYGKQLIFIILSVILIILILSIDTKFYERFSSIIYFATAKAVAAFVNSLGCKVIPPKSYHEVAPFIFFPNINKPTKESFTANSLFLSSFRLF